MTVTSGQIARARRALLVCEVALSSAQFGRISIANRSSKPNGAATRSCHRPAICSTKVYEYERRHSSDLSAQALLRLTGRGLDDRKMPATANSHEPEPEAAERAPPRCSSDETLRPFLGTWLA